MSLCTGVRPILLHERPLSFPFSNAVPQAASDFASMDTPTKEDKGELTVQKEYTTPDINGLAAPRSSWKVLRENPRALILILAVRVRPPFDNAANRADVRFHCRQTPSWSALNFPSLEIFWVSRRL